MAVAPCEPYVGDSVTRDGEWVFVPSCLCGQWQGEAFPVTGGGHDPCTVRAAARAVAAEHAAGDRR